MIPLTRRGGLIAEAIDWPPEIRRATREAENRVQYISTESLRTDELVSLWQSIALRPEEELVLKALRFLEPQIERIAPVTPSRYPEFSSRGGFIVKREGLEQPIPIGSMGDGMWRLLAMAIALIQCKDGVLLVDEIDTGLHYTVLADMWRLIHRVSNELQIQVFATTHSSDCVSALASICRENVVADSDVTIQRVEARRGEAVPYTEGEIRMAAEKGIEVR